MKIKHVTPSHSVIDLSEVVSVTTIKASTMFTIVFTLKNHDKIYERFDDETSRDEYLRDVANKIPDESTTQ